MPILTCQKCGLVNDYRISHTGEHKTAYCNGCNAYIKHLPQNQPIKLHFGKFKGREINTMLTKDELSYLQRLLTLENLKDNLRTAINQHVQA